MKVILNLEMEFELEASYSPGRPATPPSYSHGGLPPDPPEYDYEILRIGVRLYEHDGWATYWLSLAKEERDMLTKLLLNFEPFDKYAGDKIGEEYHSREP